MRVMDVARATVVCQVNISYIINYLTLKKKSWIFKWRPGIFLGWYNVLESMTKSFLKN